MEHEVHISVDAAEVAVLYHFIAPITAPTTPLKALFTGLNLKTGDRVVAQVIGVNEAGLRAWVKPAGPQVRGCGCVCLGFLGCAGVPARRIREPFVTRQCFFLRAPLPCANPPSHSPVCLARCSPLLILSFVSLLLGHRRVAPRPSSTFTTASKPRTETTRPRPISGPAGGSNPRADSTRSLPVPLDMTP